MTRNEAIMRRARLWLSLLNKRALAPGTQSAETRETAAQSEGCQSGPQGQRPNDTATPAQPQEEKNVR